VAELVTTLRRADSLADQMRADMSAEAMPQPRLRVNEPPVVPPRDLPEVVAARSWFAGRSVGVILLILGALCVLVASTIFIAVAWVELSLVIRSLILIVVTASFGLFAQLALRRGLQATAEAMAAITCSMFVLDLAAARRAGLPALADLAAAPYEILAGVLLVAAAGAGAFVVRSRERWLWSLDAAVALGMARAAMGVLRVSSDGYAVSTVTVTVLTSLLYVAWRRLRFPVAMWSAVALGGMTYLAAVSIGAQHAADQVDAGDIGRLVQAWPALTVALVAGFASIRLTSSAWRQVTACACLLPALTVFDDRRLVPRLGGGTSVDAGRIRDRSAGVYPGARQLVAGSRRYRVGPGHERGGRTSAHPDGARHPDRAGAGRQLGGVTRTAARSAGWGRRRVVVAADCGGHPGVAAADHHRQRPALLGLAPTPQGCSSPRWG
jgi:hypothetical protein